MPDYELIAIIIVVGTSKLLSLHPVQNQIKRLYKDPHIWVSWKNKHPWKNADWWWNKTPWINTNPWKNSKPWRPK